MNFAELDNAIANCLGFTNEALPQRYHSKRDKVQSIARIVAKAKRHDSNLFKEDREVSVKFDKRGNVKKARQGRLDILNAYRSMIDNEQPIEYDINEDKLYRNQVAFCGAMIRSGQFDADEFED